MAILPLFKVAILAIRQAAKPMANVLIARSIKYDRVKRTCAGAAQIMHRMEIRMKLFGTSIRVKEIAPLAEEEAIKQGATLISEGVVFGIGISLLVLETRRAKWSEGIKNEKLEKSFVNLDERLDGIEKSMHDVDHDVSVLASSSASFLPLKAERLQRMQQGQT
uniref:Optic atrophy 3 protein n=2 Tax=Guillardia theta TaxID=55529 RepID=A0A7S4URD2_GUITH|mmetsp:Transcript_43867/g.138497  ORF Transcript_43867/g.138497 Transcript_43867/m.138497 type:complete len:164 (+) Transcript_43867:326-817(+)